MGAVHLFFNKKDMDRPFYGISDWIVDKERIIFCPLKGSMRWCNSNV